MMTVADLIAKLEQLPQDAEVRLTTQPSYPLVSELGGVAIGADFLPYPEDDDPSDEDLQASNAVYLTEGTFIGYGHSDAWQVAN